LGLSNRLIFTDTRSSGGVDHISELGTMPVFSTKQWSCLGIWK